MSTAPLKHTIISLFFQSFSCSWVLELLKTKSISFLHELRATTAFFKDAFSRDMLSVCLFWLFQSLITLKWVHILHQDYSIKLIKEPHCFCEPHMAWGWLSALHMVNSAGTPSSAQEWETPVHCRREQGKRYFWGSRPGKKPQSCVCSPDHTLLCNLSAPERGRDCPGISGTTSETCSIRSHCSMSKQGNLKPGALPMWLKFLLFLPLFQNRGPGSQLK